MLLLNRLTKFTGNLAQEMFVCVQSLYLFPRLASWNLLYCTRKGSLSIYIKKNYCTRMVRALHRGAQGTTKRVRWPQMATAEKAHWKRWCHPRIIEHACCKYWLLHPKQARKKKKNHFLQACVDSLCYQCQDLLFCSCVGSQGDSRAPEHRRAGVWLIFSHLAKHHSIPFMNICPGQMCHFWVKLIHVSIKYFPRWYILQSSVCAPFPSAWQP